VPGTTHQRALRKPVLVTGATGYIGGRPVPRLLEAGYRIQCLARAPRKLSNRPWTGNPNVEITGGNIDHPATLRAVMKGCGAAYYLVHSMMMACADYRERDRVLARGFAQAAEAGARLPSEDG